MYLRHKTRVCTENRKPSGKTPAFGTRADGSRGWRDHERWGQGMAGRGVAGGGGRRGFILTWEISRSYTWMNFSDIVLVYDDYCIDRC